MGHFADILIIAVIGLILFGPKALQSMARSAGKGVGQAKDMKDKLMAELPMDEISKMKQIIPQVPLSSQQALQMLLSTDKITTGEPEKQAVEKKAEPRSDEKVEIKSEAPKIEVKSEEVR